MMKREIKGNLRNFFLFFCEDTGLGRKSKDLFFFVSYFCSIVFRKCSLKLLTKWNLLRFSP